MSVFLLSFGGIQKGGIHFPHLKPTLPWEQRWLAFFLHGHCKLHAELPERWRGAVCAVTRMYSECRGRLRGSRKESHGFVLSGVSKECVDGKCWALGLWFWLLKHRKGECSPVWKYHLLRN